MPATKDLIKLSPKTVSYMLAHLGPDKFSLKLNKAAYASLTYTCFKNWPNEQQNLFLATILKMLAKEPDEFGEIEQPLVDLLSDYLHHREYSQNLELKHVLTAGLLLRLIEQHQLSAPNILYKISCASISFTKFTKVARNFYKDPLLVLLENIEYLLGKFNTQQSTYTSSIKKLYSNFNEILKYLSSDDNFKDIMKAQLETPAQLVLNFLVKHNHEQITSSDDYPKAMFILITNLDQHKLSLQQSSFLAKKSLALCRDQTQAMLVFCINSLNSKLNSNQSQNLSEMIKHLLQFESQNQQQNTAILAKKLILLDHAQNNHSLQKNKIYQKAVFDLIINSQQDELSQRQQNLLSSACATICINNTYQAIAWCLEYLTTNPNQIQSKNLLHAATTILQIKFNNHQQNDHLLKYKLVLLNTVRNTHDLTLSNHYQEEVFNLIINIQQETLDTQQQSLVATQRTVMCENHPYAVIEFCRELLNKTPNSIQCQNLSSIITCLLRVKSLDQEEHVPLVYHKMNLLSRAQSVFDANTFAALEKNTTSEAFAGQYDQITIEELYENKFAITSQTYVLKQIFKFMAAFKEELIEFVDKASATNQKIVKSFLENNTPTDGLKIISTLLCNQKQSLSELLDYTAIRELLCSNPDEERSNYFTNYQTTRIIQQIMLVLRLAYDYDQQPLLKDANNTTWINEFIQNEEPNLQEWLIASFYRIIDDIQTNGAFVRFRTHPIFHYTEHGGYGWASISDAAIYRINSKSWVYCDPELEHAINFSNDDLMQITKHILNRCQQSVNNISVKYNKAIGLARIPLTVYQKPKTTTELIMSRSQSISGAQPKSVILNAALMITKKPYSSSPDLTSLHLNARSQMSKLYL